MSFLHKLWDDTLAGPPPDSGLGKLRKYNSFSALRSPPMISTDLPLSRSIAIPSPKLSGSGTFSSSVPSPNSFPESPIGSTTPRSPPPTPPETPRGDDVKRFTRRKTIDYPRRRPLEGADRTSPSVYDWIVITALDR